MAETLQLLAQSRLVHHVSTTVTHEITCWLPKDRRIHKGTRLTLKGDKRTWIVEDQYSTTIIAPQINRKWNVGGL